MSHKHDGTPPRRGRPPKSNAPPLSKERIVLAALEMTRASKKQPLSFRVLGTRLGVDPAALYRYIPSKDGLLLEVADGIIGEALQGFSETGSWRQDLFKLLDCVHFAYLEHPEVAVAAVTRVTRHEAEKTFTETMLRILEHTGLDNTTAVLMYRVLEDTMLAWTGFRAKVQLTPDAEEERADWEEVYRQTDPKTHPRVAAHATAMTAINLDEGFEAAISLLLDGMSLQIDALRRSNHRTSEMTK